MEIIIITFTLFFIKHFVCDFMMQTPQMIKEKGVYGKMGGILHALDHFGGTLLLGALILVINFVLNGILINPLLIFAVAILDGIVHYHIDWGKMRIGEAKQLTPRDREFWFYIGLDQLLHYLTYVAIIIILFI